MATAPKPLRRTLALLLCAALVLTAGVSLLFLAGETTHDCTGAGCAVCLQLARARAVLKQLGSAAAALRRTLLCALAVLAAAAFVFFVFHRSCALKKVRLNI